MEYDARVVAESLRRHRSERGLSLRSAGLEANVGYQTLNNYELGATGMSFENAWRLANLYGCSLDELGGRRFDGAPADAD